MSYETMKLTLGQFVWVIVISIIALWVVVLAHIVYGQDADPNYYCMSNQYPFTTLCDKQQIDKLYDSLLERAQEWNAQVEAEKAACFDTEEEAKQFLNKSGNGDYQITIPCPRDANLLNQTIPEDESGE